LAKKTRKLPSARQGIQSIEIGAILRGVLSDAKGPLALKLATRAGMSPSKAHKYLVSLARVGMTQQQAVSGHADLGPIALKMGLAALNRRDFVRYATEAAIDLNLRHDLTVMVTIWTARGPIVISLYNSSVLVVGNVSVGSILPVLRSASGRVFLAYLSRRMTDRIVRRELANSAAKRTGFELRTMKDVDGLIAKVWRLRAGWTKDDLVVGLNAIAAPIFDHQGVIVASLTILDNTDAVELGSRKSMLGELRRVSDEVSHKLGFWETKAGTSFVERRVSP
jgi:DNA-binding IclR family transcriptional regulator